MQHTETIKKNHQFRRLYQRGKSVVSPYFAIYTGKNHLPYNRVGFVTGKKIGNAVVRNRVRRRMREIYRLHADTLLLGYDFIVVARVRCAGATYRQMEKSFLSLCAKQALIKAAEK